MSEDLIRRSDAIEAIENTDWYHQNRNKDMVSGANSDEHQAWYKADDIYKALEDAPTIELKRGKWIPHKQDNGKTILWKCSECGQIIYSETETDRREFHKWCSRCGADMRGGE